MGANPSLSPGPDVAPPRLMRFRLRRAHTSGHAADRTGMHDAIARFLASADGRVVSIDDEEGPAGVQDVLSTAGAELAPPQHRRPDLRLRRVLGSAPRARPAGAQPSLSGRAPVDADRCAGGRQHGRPVDALRARDDLRGPGAHAMRRRSAPSPTARSPLALPSAAPRARAARRSAAPSPRLGWAAEAPERTSLPRPQGCPGVARRHGRLASARRQAARRGQRCADLGRPARIAQRPARARGSRRAACEGSAC